MPSKNGAIFSALIVSVFTLGVPTGVYAVAIDDYYVLWSRNAQIEGAPNVIADFGTTGQLDLTKSYDFPVNTLSYSLTAIDPDPQVGVTTLAQIQSSYRGSITIGSKFFKAYSSSLSLK